MYRREAEEDGWRPPLTGALILQISPHRDEIAKLGSCRKPKADDSVLVKESRHGGCHGYPYKQTVSGQPDQDPSFNRCPHSEASLSKSVSFA